MEVISRLMVEKVSGLEINLEEGAVLMIYTSSYRNGAPLIELGIQD